jgi:hypothetical protein
MTTGLLLGSKSMYPSQGGSRLSAGTTHALCGHRTGVDGTE